VETKLDERLLLMDVKLPEDLRGVKQVLVLEDPVMRTVSACLIENCNAARYRNSGARGLE
jgi:gamma-glutamyl phosphate reductase